MTIGIYKITNKVNGKSYIGQSTNIENRFKTHIQNSKNKNSKEYEKPLYRAFRKYGLDNFIFEILEELSVEKMAQREIFYIANSENLYNITPGGEGVLSNKLDNHNGAKVTSEIVYEIRERYKKLERRSEVYQDYRHLIGKSGFNKIWIHENWKGINSEVYTPENKLAQSKNTGNKGSKNGRAKLTEADVITIRTRRKNGETYQEVYKDYSFMTLKSFQNTYYGYNWKHIVI